MYKIPIMKDIISYLSSKRIAIYGTGNNAKIASRNLNDESIICYLDGSRNSGEFNGREIISIDKILELNIQVIFIAAEIHIEKIIYERIYEFCNKNGIMIYGMHGRNLDETFSCDLYGYDKAITKEKLLDEIEKHEVISFDVFDTLLMRRTLLSDDVFEIVGSCAKKQEINVSRFKMLRKRAEANVLNTNHTLDSIYDEIYRISDINADDIEKLKQLELIIEESCVIPRHDMIDVFNYVKALKKKIFIISDMYLPRDFIGYLLNKNGICGFTDVFVSGEYGVRKSQGLFDVYKSNIGNKLSCLHIGDHSLADGIWANVSGIDACIIPSSYKILEMSNMCEALHYANNVNERSMLGMLAATIFNSPFSLMADGRPVVRDIGQFGYCFVAPFLMGYILWLIKYCLITAPDKLLFAARDGYLLKNLYDDACELLGMAIGNRSIYFLTSRKAAIRAGLISEDDLINVKNWSENNLIMEFFGLEEETEVLKKSEYYRNGYLKYVEALGIKNYEKVVFIDFDSCGTSQYYLSKFLPFKITGAYVWNYIGSLQVFPEIDSFIEDSENVKEGILLESILSSSDTTLEGFDEKGIPLFAESNINIHEEYIGKAQDEIREYFRDYLGVLYVPGIDIGSSFSKALFDLYKEKYTNVDSSIFDDIWVEGSGFGNDMKVHL